VVPSSALPSHCSVRCTTPSPHSKHAEVSSSQVPPQVIVPPSNPALSQVAPPSSVPSQSSVPFTAPSPHIGPGSSSHMLVSKVQSLAQRSVPLSKPSSAQVRPPRAVPSQLSPVSITPSPQTGSVCPPPS